MTRIVSEPYLGSELAGLALLSLSAGAERGRMLLSGLLPWLLLPMVPLMDAGYWAPRRLGGASIGLEDGLSMAQVGAAAWFFASRAPRFDAEAMPSARAVALRIAWFTAPALGTWLALAWAGLRWGDALLGIVQGVGAALAGGLGNALWFGAQLRLWLWIWPELSGWWVPGAWGSAAGLGVPVGDIVYAGVIGAVHPVVLAALLGGRFACRGGALP